MKMDRQSAPRLLSIAGTDPCGGAGIQVDLQVFRDFQCYGLSAITAVVWQNTQGVRGFEPMSAQVLHAQLQALREDIGIDGIKIGMLPSKESVEVVTEFLAGYRPEEKPAVVLDPVMASGDGVQPLTGQKAWATMQEKLFLYVDVLTPNLHEAERLIQRTITNWDDFVSAAATLQQQGLKRVLLKGGHFQNQTSRAQLVDVWAEEGHDVCLLQALPAIDDDVRGTGCQLSSALLAAFMHTRDWKNSAELARCYLSELLHNQRLFIGKGRAVISRVDVARDVS